LERRYHAETDQILVSRQLPDSFKEGYDKEEYDRVEIRIITVNCSGG
jgi:hypothetical protein